MGSIFGYANDYQTGRSHKVGVISGEGLRMGTCEYRYFMMYGGFLKNESANP